MRLRLVVPALAIVAAAVATGTSAVGSTPCKPSWRIFPSPAVKEGEINALSVVSRNDIWAVGETGSGNQRPLAEHWDGRRWQVVPVSFEGFTELRSVAAISHDDAWAVGLADDAHDSGLVEHWDGRRWSRVRLGIDSASLWGVSGSARDDVWAVGTTLGGYLVLHWNGSSWKRVAPPASGGAAGSQGIVDFAYLNDVDALGRRNAWLVGDYPANPDSQPLAAHWNGSRWTLEDAPQTREPFDAVSARTASDVWAVGGYYTVAHWDGKRWTALPHPRLDGPYPDVAAIGPDDAWIVNPPMHWNGRTWTVARHPAIDGYLQTVAAVSPSDVWAAGFSTTTDAPLVERYACR